jgi:acetyl-CoA carboxylase carboxyltransferase component
MNGGTKMSPESKVQKLADLCNSNDKSKAAYKRLEMLFDEGSFVEIDGFAQVGDGGSGVVTGYGYVEGSLVYAFSQDSTVAGGAVGRLHATKIKKIYELAAKTGCPVVAVYDSNGTRIDEGNAVLAAYGELLALSNNVSGVVPQIAAVLGTCAGCSAMLACSADYVVMSKNAQLFMTAPFNAKADGDDTVGAGSAGNAAKSGIAHIVSEDDETAMASVKEIVSMLPSNNLSMVPVFEYEENAEGQAVLDSVYADVDSADMKAFVSAVSDMGSVVELQGDFGSNASIFLVRVQGSTVGIAAANGAVDADDCAKLARFVRTCDAFAIPVITVVNTPGFLQSAKTELEGSIRDVAKLAHAYAEATCPKISLITGQAYGPAYIALAGKGANADTVLAWPNAVISALAPETAVEFLWHDKLKTATSLEQKRNELIEEYKDTVASVFTAAQEGYVENIIEPKDTRKALISALEMLAGKRVSKLPKKHGNIPF